MSASSSFSLCFIPLRQSFSFQLYVGSKDCTQVIRLTWSEAKAFVHKLSCWPSMSPCIFFLESREERGQEDTKIKGGRELETERGRKEGDKEE